MRYSLCQHHRMLKGTGLCSKRIAKRRGLEMARFPVSQAVQRWTLQRHMYKDACLNCYWLNDVEARSGGVLAEESIASQAKNRQLQK